MRPADSRGEATKAIGEARSQNGRVSAQHALFDVNNHAEVTCHCSFMFLHLTLVSRTHAYILQGFQARHVTKPLHTPCLPACRAAASRELRVWFNADVADDMPWTFVPTQEYVRVKPGQSTLVFFTATNKRWEHGSAEYACMHW